MAPLLLHPYDFWIPGKLRIIDWYVEFKRGRTNTDDAERSGCPKLAVVPENITKVHKIVLGDRKLKLREIVLTLKI